VSRVHISPAYKVGSGLYTNLALPSSEDLV